VLEKVSGIPEDNFTINIKLFPQNFTCVAFPTSNFSDDDQISQMLNFFDRAGNFQKEDRR
jgi:hypothetical protein